MLLSTGTMQDGNLSDCLLFKAQLVPADKCVPSSTRGGVL
jgi:hypothetical protein